MGDSFGPLGLWEGPLVREAFGRLVLGGDVVEALPAGRRVLPSGDDAELAAVGEAAWRVGTTGASDTVPAGKAESSFLAAAGSVFVTPGVILGALYAVPAGTPVATSVAAGLAVAAAGRVVMTPGAVPDAPDAVPVGKAVAFSVAAELATAGKAG